MRLVKQLFTDLGGNTGGPQSCLHINLVEKLGGWGVFFRKKPKKKTGLNTNPIQDICGESINPAV